MVVKKKKQNLLEKMGINVMDAQNIQEKLEELRKTLESEMVKNVEQLTAEQRKLFDPVRGELDNYEKSIEKLDSQVEKLWDKRAKLMDEVDKITNEYYTRKNEISEVEKKKKELENTIKNTPEYDSYQVAINNIRERYDQYVKLLEQEAKRLLSQKIREELVQFATISQAKALENKQE